MSEIIKLFVVITIIATTMKISVNCSKCTTTLMRVHVKNACENFYSKRSTDDDESNRFVYNIGNDNEDEDNDDSELDFIRPPRSSTHLDRKPIIIVNPRHYPEGGYLRIDYPYTKYYHSKRKIHSVHNQHHHPHHFSNEENDIDNEDNNNSSATVNLDESTTLQRFRKKRNAKRLHRQQRSTHSKVSYCCERSDSDDVCGVHLCPISVE